MATRRHTNDLTIPSEPIHDGLERYSANVLLNEQFDPISYPASDPTDRYLGVADDGSDRYLGVADDGSDRYLGVADDGSDRYLGVADDGSDRYLGVADDGSDRYLGVADDGSDRYLGVADGSDPYGSYGLSDIAAPSIKGLASRINRRRVWYKDDHGRVDPATLPPGVEYLPSINRFQYKTWDQQGNIRVRLARKPPTEKELERMRHKSDISHSIDQITQSPTGDDLSEEWWRGINRGRAHPDGIPLDKSGPKLPYIDADVDQSSENDFAPGWKVPPMDPDTAAEIKSEIDALRQDETWANQRQKSDDEMGAASRSSSEPAAEPSEPPSQAPPTPKSEDEGEMGVASRSSSEPAAEPSEPPSQAPPTPKSEDEGEMGVASRSSSEPAAEPSEPPSQAPPTPKSEDEGEMGVASRSSSEPAAAESSDGAIRGAVVTAQGVSDPNDTYDFRWRIVDIDSLRPSHDYRTMNLNPNYDPELQPRDRQRAASLMQIPNIASKLHAPTLLEDSKTLESGPPIVGKDLQVESGNARILAMLQAKDRHPDKYLIYKNLLTSPAKLRELGFTADAIKGISNPVLVREHDLSADPAARRQFVIEANTSKVAPMSVPEQAATYADAFRDRNLLKIEPNDNMSLDAWIESGAGNDVAMDFLKALDLNSAGSMADARGKLSKRGLDSIKNSLFANVYGRHADGDRLQQELTENIDEDMRRVGAALMDSLPAAAKAEAFTRSVRRDDDLSLAGDIIAAVQKLRSIRERGIQIGDYLRQSTFDSDLTPTQKQLLAYIGDNLQSGRKLRQFLDSYNRRVVEQAPTDQGAMLGGGAMGGALSKQDIFDRTMAEFASAKVRDNIGTVKAMARDFPAPAHRSNEPIAPNQPSPKRRTTLPPRRRARTRAPQTSSPIGVFNARS